MKTSAVLAGSFAGVAMGVAAPKNLIFVIPDGMGPASSTLARTYLAMTEGGFSPGHLGKFPEIAVDMTPVGNIFTHSANNVVTDSAAAGTALATGFKTNNGMLGVTPDGKPVGSVLEAAKLKGMKAGLVATSTIEHATPAAFIAHVDSRNDFDSISGQQIGYNHPAGLSVDLLMGGGACWFTGSCRSDDLDLVAFAEEKGYTVAMNRTQFDDFELGKGETRLPFLGVFTEDSDLAYEIDRKQQPEDVREPSLREMSEAAVNALHRATHCKENGYFLMIESSRIDHAAHANDPAALLGDVLEYNEVIDFVTKWVDEHPDTAMISVADHETGGMMLNGQYDPTVLADVTHSTAALEELWSGYEGDDNEAFLREEILPKYGLGDATEEEVTALLEGDFAGKLAEFLSDRATIGWTTGGHTGTDVTLYAYAAGDLGKDLVSDLVQSGWDNTEIAEYIEKALDVSRQDVTDLLRENW